MDLSVTKVFEVCHHVQLIIRAMQIGHRQARQPRLYRETKAATTTLNMAENSHVAQEISVICALCRGLVFNDATNDAQDPKWERTDTLPDLPGLTASAHDGCSCCAYLRFLIKEKLPPRQVAALVDANPGSAISITLDSPAYMSHSDQVDVSIWGSSDYSKLPDGLYSINLLFHHEIWEQPWRSRAWIYAGTGALETMPV